MYVVNDKNSSLVLGYRCNRLKVVFVEAEVPAGTGNSQSQGSHLRNTLLEGAGDRRVRIERRLRGFAGVLVMSGNEYTEVCFTITYCTLRFTFCAIFCICAILYNFFKVMFHITNKLTVKLGKQKHNQAFTTQRNVMTSQTAWLPLPVLPQPSHVMTCDLDSLGLFLLYNMGMITIPASWGGCENWMSKQR